MSMKKINLSLSAALLLTFSTSSYSLGYTEWTVVTDITQGLGSSPNVQVSNMGDAATSCSDQTSLKIRDADSAVGKRHFSTLLSALSTGKEVRILTSECSNSAPYIDKISIRK